MSDESVNKEKVEVKAWGIPGGIFWPVAVFFLSQLAAAPIIPYFLHFAAGLSVNLKNVIFQTLLELLILGIIWLVIKFYKTNWSSVGLKKAPNLKHLGWALVGFGVYVLASAVINITYQAVTGDRLDEQQNIGYSTLQGNIEPALVFLLLVIAVPVVEEVLFRGFMFTGLRRGLGFWPSAVIVSLIFALIHGQLNVGLDVFALSLVLCYLRENMNSLWPSIMLHMTKNLIAFMALKLQGIL